MSYTVPDDVAWVDGSTIASGGETVFLMRVPDGRPMVLTGSAAAIWTLAITGVDPVAGIAELTGEAEDVIAPDTLAFLADLVDRGLLAPRSAPEERKRSS